MRSTKGYLIDEIVGPAAQSVTDSTHKFVDTVKKIQHFKGGKL